MGLKPLACQDDISVAEFLTWRKDSNGMEWNCMGQSPKLPSIKSWDGTLTRKNLLPHRSVSTLKLSLQGI